MTYIDFEELKNGQLVELYGSIYIVLGEGPFHSKNAFCVKNHKTYGITKENSYAFNLVKYHAE